MTKKQTTTLSIMIIVIIALTLLVSRRLWFRLDLTRGKSYTISAVSRSLHNEIPDQIRLTYYLSDKLKSIHPLPGEIEDLLREYAGFSRGKIQLTVRDPAKANLAEQIEQLGILPQQIQTVEQDQASVTTVYTGIVIEYLDQLEVLPMVFSLETLEYDLTSRIRSLVRGNARLLGVIAGDGPQRWNESYRQLQGAYMQAGYQLRLIGAGQEIGETIPALLVLGGVESLDEAALYQIDRYIQTGGKVLFTVKGIRVDMEASLEARLLSDSGLLDMLSSYGAVVLPEIVMDQSSQTIQYQTPTSTGAVMMRIAPYPQWVRVLRKNGNPAHPVSANFSDLDLYWASPLRLNAPDGVEADYLFTSTVEAWSMREPFHTNPEVPYLFQRDAADTSGEKILAVSLSGVFPSWFAGKPMPELPAMPSQPKPARLIVVGETEFTTSRFINTNHANFLIKAADWLCNDDDIIQIRSKSSQSGGLDKIIDTGKKASAMKFAQIVNVFVVPSLVIIAGLFFALRRRTKAKEHSHDV